MVSRLSCSNISIEKKITCYEAMNKASWVILIVSTVALGVIHAIYRRPQFWFQYVKPKTVSLVLKASLAALSISFFTLVYSVFQRSILQSRNEQ